MELNFASIHPCHTAAILSRKTKRALFYHAKNRNGNHGDEAQRGKTRLFGSPGAIWPPCDKGELPYFLVCKSSLGNLSSRGNHSKKSSSTNLPMVIQWVEKITLHLYNHSNSLLCDQPQQGKRLRKRQSPMAVA